MDGAHCEASVFSIELNWEETRLAIKALVDLVKPSLHHFEGGLALFAAPLQLVLHILGVVHAPRKIVRWRWLVVKLNFEEELCIQVVRLDVDLSSEFYDVSEHNQLLGVPDEKGLRVKRIGFVHDVWLDQSVEGYFVFFFLLLQFRVFALVVVWVGVVHFVPLLVENLDFHEVDALLDQVDVSKVLQVDHEFHDRAK